MPKPKKEEKTQFEKLCQKLYEIANPETCNDIIETLSKYGIDEKTMQKFCPEDKKIEDRDLYLGTIKTSYYDIGCYIHTALRKGCDSLESTLAYNVIRLADESWIIFIKYCHNIIIEHTNGKCKTKKQLEEPIRHILKNFDDIVTIDDYTSIENKTEHQVFCTTLKILKDNDILSIINYIGNIFNLEEY